MSSTDALPSQCQGQRITDLGHTLCSRPQQAKLGPYLSLQQCMAGAHDVDRHFREAPFEQNIPVLLGLASVWNVSFLGYPARAILPYTQALSKLAPHIQQVQPMH